MGTFYRMRDAAAQGSPVTSASGFAGWARPPLATCGRAAALSGPGLGAMALCSCRLERVGTARQAQEDRVRIVGAKAQPGPADGPAAALWWPGATPPCTPDQAAAGVDHGGRGRGTC